MKKISLPLSTYIKFEEAKKSLTPTESQAEHRAKFKASAQFNSYWAPINALFLLGKYSHRKYRAFVGSIAYKVSYIENHAAVINLSDFENAINSKTHQYASPDMVVTFTAVAQNIIAPDGDVVTYQIVAFDEKGTPIGFNTVTYESDGTAKVIDLPAIKGEAKRYDIMAYNTTIGEGIEYNGALGEISGKNASEIITTDAYVVLVNTLEKANGKVHGLQTGSFLVTP